MYTLPKIERFNENVLSKYIYIQCFYNLPFDSIDNTGCYFLCLQRFAKKVSETEKRLWISLKNTSPMMRKIKLILCSVFIERQIVLFDAVEDAAFP
jgi:phosphoenolpyruvate carboxylase